MTNGVPAFKSYEFAPKHNHYCLCIPVINEGQKILHQLDRLCANHLHQQVDVIICDGGSTDGSMAHERLKTLGVNTLLEKTGAGKLSAQLRMGYSWALERGYAGIITVDGNDKDSVESIPLFMAALDAGYDLVQGSRYIAGGQAINTPRLRHIAVKLIHIPLVSFAAGYRYSDTTNGFRAYSRSFLLHPGVQPFRDIFVTYELLAYLSVRAPRLGLRVTEVPVTRRYPKMGKTPTKISFIKGNWDLIRILFELLVGKYNPDSKMKEYE